MKVAQAEPTINKEDEEIGEQQLSVGQDQINNEDDKQIEEERIKNILLEESVHDVKEDSAEKIIENSPPQIKDVKEQDHTISSKKVISDKKNNGQKKQSK